ncbi:hypothetical protein HBI67_029710 [Parastagonospora nodorum]|nr:hypothetical protein HBI12_185230 [Parastagonospora nodorum]KAH5409207.1 hypothetical protein HBI47_168520 [Parastagonospora nodorum]KAH6080842.1 hypothetical protein HBI66_067800 [Parastagonospora nodorum]KAH6083860.1 hypothetical protein HBI67_029710 [Parastagonospora nodorum]
MIRPTDLFRSIYDLPTELLFQIGAHFTHNDRNQDLLQLSLVSKRWRNIAQEWLIKAPRFKLTHVDKYISQLMRHERLQPQVTSLEICSLSEHRIPRNQYGLAIRLYHPTRAPVGADPDFIARCESIINTAYCQQIRIGSTDALQWKVAMRQDCLPALLTVLVSMLPNLRELKLGNTWLMDFPIFSTMLSPDVVASSMIPSPWLHPWLEGIKDTLRPKLAVLNVPADMSCLHFSRQANTVFEFRRFTALRELAITSRALCPVLFVLIVDNCGLSGPHQFAPPDPRELFPPSLQVLRVSEADPQTHRFVEHLCKAKMGGHLPALRRIEVYHMLSNKRVLAANPAFANRDWDPTLYLQKSCRDAELALYVYVPDYEMATWILGRSPWLLREEHDIFAKIAHDAFWKAIGHFAIMDEGARSIPYEAEWDSDGDLVM